MIRLYGCQHEGAEYVLDIETDTRGKARAYAVAEFGCDDFTCPELHVWLAREMVCLKHERPLVFYVPLRCEDDECGYCSGEWGYD